jgi:hypothetical protein
VTPIQAAEWRIEPLIRAAGDFDDNAVLTTRTDVDADISGYIVDVAAKFAYASELTNFFITPLLRSRNYGDLRFDSDDQFLRFDLDHDAKSSNFRFRGEYSRESVRTAERADADLDVEDPDEIPDDESGRVGIRDRREKIWLNPRWTYRMSDVSSVAANLYYNDISYDEAFLGLLTDYSDARVELSYLRAWSPRTTATLTGSYRQYSPDGGDDVTGTGIKAGFYRRISETTQFRALVGLEDTDRAGGETDVDYVADISLSRRLQTITMLVQYRATISGGGTGSLVNRDSFNLNFTRELNEKISAGLGVRAYQTNGLDQNILSSGSRDYIQLRSQFIWNLTRNWSLEANYRYTFLDRTEFGEGANSNNVTIWLSYRPTPIIRSR